jgi:hypothetical protein
MSGRDREIPPEHPIRLLSEQFYEKVPNCPAVHDSKHHRIVGFM